MKKINQTIAFFGDSSARKKDTHFIDAYEIAQILAINGFTIANGGGPGIMLAASLGAKSANGKIELSIISPDRVPGNYEGVSPENLSLASRVHELSNYENRLNKLIDIASAYIIFYGGTGTLAEMCLVWSKAKFDYPQSKPIIFFGKKWPKIIKTLSTELNLERNEIKLCHFATNSDQVLKIIKDYSR